MAGPGGPARAGTDRSSEGEAMNGGGEEMVGEGLDRLTEGARPPAGLVNRARRHRSRRRLAAGSAIAGATAAVTVAAVITTGSAAGPGASTSMRNTAYV